MRILYVYDALCGWCYGFSPIIEKFYKQYKDEYPFEVVSGGMIIGDREGPIGNMSDYIKKAYKVVEDRTGVQFGDNFLKVLDEGDTIFSSVMPSRAMAAFKMTSPDDQVLFAKEIQRAIYYDGLPPAEKDTYLSIMKTMGASPEFLMNFNLPASEELAIQDFKLTQKLEVQGFPSVFVEDKGRYVMICHGYMPFQQLNENLDRGVKMLMEKQKA